MAPYLVLDFLLEASLFSRLICVTSSKCLDNWRSTLSRTLSPLVNVCPTCYVLGPLWILLPVASLTKRIFSSDWYLCFNREDAGGLWDNTTTMGTRLSRRVLVPTLTSETGSAQEPSLWKCTLKLETELHSTQVYSRSGVEVAVRSPRREARQHCRN